MTLKEFISPVFKSITTLLYKTTESFDEEGSVKIIDCSILERSLFVRNGSIKFYFPLNQEVKTVELGIIINDITGKQYELNFFSNDKILNCDVIIELIKLIPYIN